LFIIIYEYFFLDQDFKNPAMLNVKSISRGRGMRDIISHHYFDLNSEIVFDVCKNEIPKLRSLIFSILKDEFNYKEK